MKNNINEKGLLNMRSLGPFLHIYELVNTVFIESLRDIYEGLDAIKKAQFTKGKML